MGSKVNVLFGLVLAVTLIVSSEVVNVAARELKETPVDSSKEQAVVNKDQYPGGGFGGYPGGGYPGGGYPGGGFGGYPRWGGGYPGGGYPRWGGGYPGGYPRWGGGYPGGGYPGWGGYRGGGGYP